MANFQVILQSQPQKYYRKTDSKTAGLLQKCFRQLENNPFYFPGKIKRLKGREGLFRYAIDGIRVVYEIDLRTKRVGVLAILPRGDIYKRI